MESLPFSFPLDYVIIFAVFALAAFWAFRGNAAGVQAATLALGLGYFISQAISEAAFVGEWAAKLPSEGWMQLLPFVVISGVLMVALARVLEKFESSGEVLVSLLSALAFTAMMLAVWYQLPHVQNIWDFGSGIDFLFTAQYLWWWMVGSIGLLYLGAQSG